MSVTNDKSEYKKYEEIDWGAIQWEYENTRISMKALGEKYGTYAMMISREARRREWVKYDPIRIAVDEYKKNKAISNPGGMLDTVAVRKINEIVKELGDNYSPVDEPLVVMYAKSYQRYLELEKIVDDEGVVCISPKTGGKYMNPYFSALQALVSNVSRLGDKLGLSISARKRIGLSFGEDKKTGSLFDMVEILSQDDDIDV